MRSHPLTILTTLFAAIPVAWAQPKAPPPPERFDVSIRYAINADRNERVLQFDEMTKYFRSVGFVETPGDDNDLAAFDSQATKMVGTIPSSKAKELLKDRRVKLIQLKHPDYAIPADDNARVRILVDLNQSRDSLLLHRQTAVVLGTLGFKEELGYDTLRFTQLKGSIPAGRLPELLKDLRGQPSGWLLPETPEQMLARTPEGFVSPWLKQPFADAIPIRVVEVLGEVPPVPAVVSLPPIPADQPQQSKWTADLRRAMAEDGFGDKPSRLEIVLGYLPTDTEFAWRDALMGLGCTIEGRTGSVVTVTVPKANMALAIASAETVNAVRLPRPAARTEVVAPAEKKDPPKNEPKKLAPSSGDRRDATGPLLPAIHQSGPTLPTVAPDENPLKASRLDLLHAANKRGAGVRVIVIDTDFAGWTNYFGRPGAKRTGPPVHFVDLTAERNRDVQPDPMPGEFGHGTHCALTVRFAAPECELVLVRVAVDAPYQLLNVARFIRGEQFSTDGFNSRRRELAIDAARLKLAKTRAMEEYRRAFSNFDDKPEAEKARRDAQADLAKLNGDDEQLIQRIDRLDNVDTQLKSLKGAQIVVCQLNWNTGFALDGGSSISRFLDDWLIRDRTSGLRPIAEPGAPPVPNYPVAVSGYTRSLTRVSPGGSAAAQRPLWFQPAGNTRGQTWTGVFRDADGNSAMEFAPTTDPIRPDRWSRELNFLATESGEGRAFDLTAGSKIRISVQWREPHDPDIPEFEYVSPLAAVRLQLVKQRDPTGTKIASDEIDVVAESEGLPERLVIEKHYGIYEHSLEVTLPADGRYALRVECRLPDLAADPRNVLGRTVIDIPTSMSRLPNTIRPYESPKLANQAVRWELRPRFHVESADGKGRVVFGDYSSQEGGVAVPADARGVLTIGACGADGKPRSFSAAGAGPNVQLATKPDYLAPDSMPRFHEEPSAVGSSLSASFAGGWAASVMSAGVSAGSFQNYIKLPPGAMIGVPSTWFKR